MTAAVLVDDVSKTYVTGWQKRPKEALRGVSLQIETGETFGFIGPNGAGKSTLIKVLIGALRATSGRASLFGVDVQSPDSRRRLGFVPENPSLQDYLTPIEIVKMAIRLHKVPFADENRHVLEWIDRFGLAHVANTRLREFSKGMMQRTALAQALAIKPRLLILDEPLSGLDPVGRRDVVDVLDEYRKGGGTLFFSSHMLHDVERIADRFGLVDHGQLITIRSVEEMETGQTRRYVVRFIGAVSLPLARELRPGHFSIEVDESELPEIIARIASASGRLQDVKPALSLESVFFSQLSTFRGQ